MAAKEYALDIFKVLGELDRKNFYLWDKLTPEEQKGFSPLIALRWMAGIEDQRQIIFLNEIVNMSIFNITTKNSAGQETYDKDFLKEMMMKLLAVCSSGKTQRYSWVNYKFTNSKKKIAVGLISEHYGMSLKDAEDTVKLFSPGEILELAEAAGFQKDEIKLLKKEVGA